MEARRRGGAGSRERGAGNGAGRRGRDGHELIGFFAVRMDGDGKGSGVCLIPDEILYAFTSGAVNQASDARRNPVIVARWTRKLHFPSGIVFLRNRKGLYRSYVRTLREFERMVPASGFEMVSRSVIANLRAVSSIDLGHQRIKTLSYAVEESEFSWPHELVVVSRNCLKGIRSSFAMPPRLRTGP